MALTDKNLIWGHRLTLSQLEGCLSLESVLFDISRHGAHRSWDGRHTLHQNGIASGNSFKLSYNHSVAGENIPTFLLICKGQIFFYLLGRIYTGSRCTMREFFFWISIFNHLKWWKLTSGEVKKNRAVTKGRLGNASFAASSDVFES